MASEKNDNKFYIIGMSPGNSYFKDEEVRFLIESIVRRFGRVAILIADVPAISTYMAFGYPENRARSDKAMPQGNLLRNRVKRVMVQLGYSDSQVKIINWEEEVENNPKYLDSYKKVRNLYETNKGFMEAADKTTLSVLKSSNRDISDFNKATKIAVHYLLSEISFLEWAPEFLNKEKVVYVYHKNWPVYEDYIAGKFDNKIKKYMDFLLLENPWETYNSIWGIEDEEEVGKYKSVLDRVKNTRTLRVAFSNYPPALTYDYQYDNFGGIFYEIIVRIARKNGWKIIWSEETGYGVVIDGLNNNRFDVFGSPIWPIPERKEKANPSISLYSSKVYPWIRSDFKYKKSLNDENLRVAVKENDISDYIYKKKFQNAHCVFVPQLESILDLLRFVVDDKADFTFTESAIVEIFNKTSKKKLVKATKEPIEIFENTFLFRKEDNSLKDIFNKEIKIMESDGTIKKLIDKYSPKKGLFVLAE
jgi:tRNA-dependent cyclodipeptide synthase